MIFCGKGEQITVQNYSKYMKQIRFYLSILIFCYVLRRLLFKRRSMINVNNQSLPYIKQKKNTQINYSQIIKYIMINTCNHSFEAPFN